MRVAVLGAGFQGCCVALELVRRGVAVDLYDRNALPVTQAGYVNEGRIHLGFNYSNDPSFATARLMARGALVFRRYLGRWIDIDPLIRGGSDEVYYAVQARSLVSLEKTRGYFQELDALINRQQAKINGEYLGDKLDSTYEEIGEGDYSRFLDPDRVSGVFRTAERSVNATQVAERIRDAVSNSELITFYPGSLIQHLDRDGHGYSIDIAGDKGISRVSVPLVVNALWDGRLLIDSAMGYLPDRPWLHRFKYGIFVDSLDKTGVVNSVAFVCGPFGDIVRYRNGDLYLSWYPDCMWSISPGLTPPELPRNLPPQQARELFERTWRALSDLCPVLGSLSSVNDCRYEVRGGNIVAWGESDIDDASSELHMRSEAGVSSHQNYHSINTGKYTLAPMLAMEVADRVCGH